jgi:hypothetical protein
LEVCGSDDRECLFLLKADSVPIDGGQVSDDPGQLLPSTALLVHGAGLASMAGVGAGDRACAPDRGAAAELLNINFDISEVRTALDFEEAFCLCKAAGRGRSADVVRSTVRPECSAHR